MLAFKIVNRIKKYFGDSPVITWYSPYARDLLTILSDDSSQTYITSNNRKKIRWYYSRGLGPWIVKHLPVPDLTIRESIYYFNVESYPRKKLMEIL